MKKNLKYFLLVMPLSFSSFANVEAVEAEDIQEMPNRTRSGGSQSFPLKTMAQAARRSVEEDERRSPRERLADENDAKEGLIKFYIDDIPQYGDINKIIVNALIGKVDKDKSGNEYIMDDFILEVGLPGILDAMDRSGFTINNNVFDKLVKDLGTDLPLRSFIRVYRERIEAMESNADAKTSDISTRSHSSTSSSSNDSPKKSLQDLVHDIEKELKEQEEEAKVRDWAKELLERTVGDTQLMNQNDLDFIHSLNMDTSKFNDILKNESDKFVADFNKRLATPYYEVEDKIESLNKKYKYEE